jgi:hypothetical protein
MSVTTPFPESTHFLSIFCTHRKPRGAANSTLWMAWYCHSSRRLFLQRCKARGAGKYPAGSCSFPGTPPTDSQTKTHRANQPPRFLACPAPVPGSRRSLIAPLPSFPRETVIVVNALPGVTLDHGSKQPWRPRPTSHAFINPFMRQPNRSSDLFARL